MMQFLKYVLKNMRPAFAGRNPFGQEFSRKKPTVAVGSVFYFLPFQQ